jgi:hypothetical protein
MVSVELYGQECSHSDDNACITFISHILRQAHRYIERYLVSSIVSDWDQKLLFQGILAVDGFVVSLPSSAFMTCWSYDCRMSLESRDSDSA